MQQIFEYLWLYFPLGMIGFYRWSVWGFKRMCAQRYEPIQIGVPTYYSSLGIVTPVYNEDPALFKKALESWEASYPDELIAVIDKQAFNRMSGEPGVSLRALGESENFVCIKATKLSP